VLDGVGGREGGAVASQETKNFLKAALQELSPKLSAQEVVSQLVRILQEANDNLLQLRREGPYPEMGTTASVVWFVESVATVQQAVIANVGDSRVYVWRATTQKLEQITLDDNLVSRDYEIETEARSLQQKFNNVIDPSELTESEKEYFESRNMITQVLGRQDTQPRTYIVDLSTGDKLLVSSDGLHDNLTDLQIEALLRQDITPQQHSERLAALALDASRAGSHRSKRDDISVCVVEVTGSSAPMSDSGPSSV